MLISRNTKDLERTTNDLDEVIDPRYMRRPLLISDWKIHNRDWSKGFSEKQKNEYGPAQAYGPRAGCIHQLYIAIRIKEDNHYRHVGTITVGFKSKPDRKKVDPIMKRWASEEEGSAYVTVT